MYYDIEEEKKACQRSLQQLDVLDQTINAEFDNSPQVTVDQIMLTAIQEEVSRLRSIFTVMGQSIEATDYMEADEKRAFRVKFNQIIAAGGNVTNRVDQMIETAQARKTLMDGAHYIRNTMG